MGKKSKAARSDAKMVGHAQKDGNSIACGNAGVLVVGQTSDGTPAVLLGGRWYTGRKVYEYTDFGGGVEPDERREPHLAAFREFLEELFGLSAVEARLAAVEVWAYCKDKLLGGRPMNYKGRYTMHLVPADALVMALEELGLLAGGPSAIEALLTHGRQNSELTSLALVDLELFVEQGLSTGIAPAIQVRNLDGKERPKEVHMRKLMVGPDQSIAFCADHLLRYARGCGKDRKAGASTSRTSEAQLAAEADQASLPEATPAFAVTTADADRAAQTAPTKMRRWNRQPAAANVSDQGSQGQVTTRQVLVPMRRTKAGKKSFVFDMETGDPDDVLTLILLASHPDVDLRAVTLTPGSDEQVALVRWIFRELGLDVRLGAQEWPRNRRGDKLRGHFYQSFGRVPVTQDSCEPAEQLQVLLECCDESVTLLTGGPLHNLGRVLGNDGFRLGRWVAQGGFAGQGVVPDHLQMDKFRGKVTCPTWNFGGNIPAAEAALAAPCIQDRVLVSKNVCHRVVYDEVWHRSLKAAAERARSCSLRTRALAMIFGAMDSYLKRKPDGKKLHDPLALAVALDESVCELTEVRVFSQKGHWGSKLCPGSGTRISIDYDADKFRSTLLDD